jgi:pyruvate dehydrogenase E2 component (dihydrolipoamide acetyltransferase)
VGEGLTEGEIVQWLVREGDFIVENQPLVRVLTDKAEVEIPSPKTGTIRKILAKDGEKVAVHSVLVEIEVQDKSQSQGQIQQGSAAHAAITTNKTTTVATTVKTSPQMQTLATPAVRKLAQDLKVDLASLSGTGPGGRITEQDVRRASGNLTTAPTPTPTLGPEERMAFKGIRRRTAERMVQAVQTIPHVTHCDEADVTELMTLRESLKTEAEKKGVKLTYLPFILKALIPSLKEFPHLNASLDETKGEIALKKYYNIGIAVSTEHGLYVPVLKNADKKDIWALAQEILSLAGKAKNNALSVEDSQSGTFTVTNIGPIGGISATPLIHPPQTGILAVMKIQERPVVRDGKILARSIMNLALSFDHRVLDGAEAASFTNALIRRLESPRQLL